MNDSKQLARAQRKLQEYIVTQIEGCWGWKGPLLNSGYPLLEYNGTNMASRVYWMLNKGPIPQNMCIFRICQTRICLRPDHLFCGTFSEGWRIKGDYRKHHRAKLNRGDIPKIRAKIAAGQSNKQIAAEYGVHPQVISGIKNNMTWKHC